MYENCTTNAEFKIMISSRMFYIVRENPAIHIENECKYLIWKIQTLYYEY